MKVGLIGIVSTDVSNDTTDGIRRVGVGKLGPKRLAPGQEAQAKRAKTHHRKVVQTRAAISSKRVYTTCGLKQKTCSTATRNGTQRKDEEAAPRTLRCG